MASAGATAALAGLVFVAMSINITRILALRGVPELGLVTILLLVGALAASLFGLIPDQDPQTLGIELLAQSLGFTAAIGFFACRSAVYSGGHYGSRIVLPLFGTVPFVAGSILLAAGAESGIYWIFAGVLGAILAAVLGAWILLVEILR